MTNTAIAATPVVSLYFVRAKIEDEDTDVDLLVWAYDDTQVEPIWRQHYKGWELPEKPESIKKVPVLAQPGAVKWNDL